VKPLLLLKSSLCVVICLFVSAFTWAANPPSDHTTPSTQVPAPAAATGATVTIPGPLRSFLRMAGISQKISAEEVLPLLSRNVAVEGYQGRKDSRGRSTEFLLLLKRYVEQARALVAITGPDGVIRVSDCDQAGPLLAVLGYRLRQGCGKGVALETAEPEKAFLTIDSGFPLAQLEVALQGGKPFAYPFASSQVPVLFSAADWTQGDPQEKHVETDVLNALLDDPVLARLYWAMARMDGETGETFRQFAGIPKLLPFAAVLDFYGSHIRIRNGRVNVPGGMSAEPAWKSLAGADPGSAKDFVARLLAKDDGWMAAYFDALSRVSQKQQPYFTDSHHLRNFYEALRGKDLSPSPTRHSFRPDQGLFLLVNRLQLEASGQPHIPGGIEVWKETMRGKSDSRIVREWGKRAGGWNNPDQVVEGMVAISRVSSREGPLNAFLALVEIDRNRSPEQRLNPATARLLADKFERYGDQYLIFSEFPSLSNASIARFFTVADGLNKVPDRLVRADALGILQANIGLWQVLTRQGQIKVEINTNPV